MVRMLIASMAMSIATASMACDTCGCRDKAPEATQVKAAEKAQACQTTCATAGAQAAVTQVAGEGAVCSEADKAACIAKGEECATACATACEGEPNAAQASLVGYMPKMTFKVGDESTCCPKTAAALAKKSNDHVHYMVNNVSYDDKAEAMGAHAKQLHNYMMDLVRIQYAVNGECVACPDSAKAMAASCTSKNLQYKVGPATFDSAEAAIKASVMAWNAAKNVSMQYAVGDEVTTCSKSAGAMADKASCSVEYVVNGQRTNCSKTAKYMQTVASVESALKALETASAGDA